MTKTKYQAKRRRTGRSKVRTAPSARSRSRSLVPRMRSVAIAGPRMGIGMSDTTWLRGSFTTTISTSVATGAYNGYLRPGSAYEPFGSMSNTQCVLYDQYVPIFNRYKVDKAIVKITIQGDYGGAATGSVYEAAAYPHTDTTALVSFNGASAQAGAKRVSGGFVTVSGGAFVCGVGYQPTVMKFKLDTATVVGIKDPDCYSNGALTNATPPTKQHMVLPFMIQLNQVAVATFRITFDIQQLITFNERKPVVDA